MNTLGQLRDSIVRQIWADHAPEGLEEARKQIVLEALSDIQKYVPCEREKQANVIQFCNSWYRCGFTLVPRPKGVIKFVYTIADGDWCNPVFYQQGTRQEIECYFPHCLTLPTSEDATVPVLPMGFKRADASTDSVTGRARRGMWAIDGDNVMIAPWIQSSESVVIEWSGIKGASEWTDEDPVSDAIDFRKAVKLYLQYGHERDYGDQNVALTFHNNQKSGTYDEALSDLMLQCVEETRIRPDDSCKECHPLYCTYYDLLYPFL